MGVPSTDDLKGAQIFRILRCQKNDLQTVQLQPKAAVILMPKQWAHAYIFDMIVTCSVSAYKTIPAK